MLWVGDGRGQRICQVIEPRLKREIVVPRQLENLWNSEGSVRGMQECIHQTGVVAQVGRCLPVHIKMMPSRQHIDCALDVAYTLNVLVETKLAEHLLQHIDADARIGAIKHYAHDAVRLED